MTRTMNEARMVGVSIAALSLLLTLPGASPAVARDASASLPGIKMPHVPMPKVRLPRLTKRNGSSEAVVQTKRRLKALVGDQEAWYSDHGSYGANANTMARNATRTDSSFDKVQIQVLYAGKKGWTAMASHPDAPGKSCVIYVGYRNALPMIPRTRADALDASAEAQPACDR
ncbi:MAG: hypothetical protein IPP90_17720 [Gemmatimonadaceae bacterium]|nr:hypothetical protein [Gemmatimonadaceae bacterium]